ncbi:flagellar biosynthesis protein FlhF [Robbsia sp. Bb-Pol-6]|uniref:Flagellar biosynthesis protein FlhF n=1 Tax=Robbsia betulipollinis TaxID=2981849 RepID=A0ABT3ZHM4_9BURK|nr:flagellar biosynthesis protein FlhF [Robbsia betulipollinis]MCY0386026.1 flagellar biosynthesis protein FlhF [Robbsia betulipollinis]
MKVRKFFAPSSREALRLVREALGADAVVLSNRVVDGGVELVALTEETLTDIVDERQAPAAMPAAHASAPAAEARVVPSWRDAVPARAARPAPSFPQTQPPAGRRDRTIAPPGVLAAANIGEDGASALAYVHRGNPAPQARANVAPAYRTAPAAPAPSPYDDVAAYDADDEGDDVYGNGAAHDRDDGHYRAHAGAAVNPRDVQEETGAVWTPSALAAPRQAPGAASLASAAAAPIAAPAAVPVTVPPAAGMRANGASASIAASRLAAANVPAAPAAPAPAAPPASARSIFARMFSRPSFRERVANADDQAAIPARREQATAPALSQADEASVLGLVRAERRESPQNAGVLGLGRAERTDDDAFVAAPREARRESGMTPSAAAARGLGSATGPIVTRPSVAQEEQMLARVAATAPVAPVVATPPAAPAPVIEPVIEHVVAPVAAPVVPVAAMAPEVAVPVAPIVPEVVAPIVPEALSAVQTAAPAVAPATIPAPQVVSPTAPLAVASPDSVDAQRSVESRTGAADVENTAPSFAPSSYGSQTRVRTNAGMTPMGLTLPFVGAASAPAPVVAAAPVEVVAPVAPVAAAAPVEVAAPVAVTAPVETVAPDAPAFTAAEVPALDLSSAPIPAEVEKAVTQPATPAPSSPRAVAGEVLSEMRTLCGTLGEQLAALGEVERERRDPTRIAMTRTLLACGFSAQLVRLLLAKMPSVDNAEQGMSWVKATFERNLPVLDNEDSLMEQGGVFALMGPTGVGKTTTTAKLAARAVMRHGADRVALLTTDSYRIGAHEQLRIYGRILGVAVHAVKDAADLSLVLSELRNKHMVLIDTIGMSQRDRAVSEQVSMLCRTHLPVKRLLLLNATSHGDTLNEVVRAYGAHGEANGESLSGCIITKVDESNGIGAALDTVMRHRLPVHYVSNGQKVPEDLRVARRGFLIENAFSERQQASPFQPDEDDIALMFGADAHIASSAMTAQSGGVHFG